ncbi:hypothetical protein [Kineococcus sp. SYSU DK003]|uniref:hypothetical protein n=1 Tax=Kineococcus sp. SYSU DK003 TaxID=3383124 RepID=UPI003D7EA101
MTVGAAACGLAGALASHPVRRRPPTWADLAGFTWSELADGDPLVEQQARRTWKATTAWAGAASLLGVAAGLVAYLAG